MLDVNLSSVFSFGKLRQLFLEHLDTLNPDTRWSILPLASEIDAITLLEPTKFANKTSRVFPRESHTTREPPSIVF